MGSASDAIVIGINDYKCTMIVMHKFELNSLYLLYSVINLLIICYNFVCFAVNVEEIVKHADELYSQVL